MNSKGQTVIYSFMLGILFMFLGLALSPSIKDVTYEAMNSTSLNCSTTDVQQTRAVCTSIDMFLPFFSALIFGLAGFVIGMVAIR